MSLLLPTPKGPIPLVQRGDRDYLLGRGKNNFGRNFADTLILHALLEEVLEDPKKNTTKYLETQAIELDKLPESELRKMGEKGKDKKLEEEEKELKEIRDKYWVK